MVGVAVRVGVRVGVVVAVRVGVVVAVAVAVRVAVRVAVGVAVVVRVVVVTGERGRHKRGKKQGKVKNTGEGGGRPTPTSRLDRANNQDPGKHRPAGRWGSLFLKDIDNG